VIQIVSEGNEIGKLMRTQCNAGSGFAHMELRGDGDASPPVA